MTRIVAMIVSLLLIGPAMGQSQGLVVHEWGTFTSLQDENGQSVGGIGEDTEALPAFVVDLNPGATGKGIAMSPAMAAAVTMRLETPVVYFYPPKNSPGQQITFSAQFRGGLLTQFYPVATATAVPNLSTLSEKSVGTLIWDNLKIGTETAGPPTTSPIWLAPREVSAANVTSANGQSERYLFYRGLGHLDGPVTAIRQKEYLHLVRSSATPADVGMGALQIDTLWLADIRADGTTAFRRIDAARPNYDTGLLGSTSANFAEADYRADALETLKKQMHEALVADGLFADEAAAMLKTWDHAYFKSPGTRVFYLVPQAWTDHYLPIQLSTAATVERVMVGRIDLITPAQREMAGDYLALQDPRTIEAKAMLSRLGRFASPIVASERSRRQTAALAAPAP